MQYSEESTTMSWLVKYCIKVWWEVDCQLTTGWCLTNTGNQTGRKIATFTFSFLQMAFFRDFFTNWLIVTIKFKCTAQSISDMNLLKYGKIFILHNISSKSAAREEIKVMQWVLLSFEPNVVTAVVTNPLSIRDTEWSKETVNCNFFLTGLKITKSGITEPFLVRAHREVLIFWCLEGVRWKNTPF